MNAESGIKNENEGKHLVALHHSILQFSGPNNFLAKNAKIWKKNGLRITIICQDQGAQAMQLVNSYIHGQFPVDAPRLGNGELRVVVPPVNNLIPVLAMHQLIEFPGMQVKKISQMTNQQMQTNINMTIKCLRAVCLHDRPYKVISNYMIMSGIICQKGLQDLNIKYDITVPGPALRYAVIPYPHLWQWILPAFKGCNIFRCRTKFVKNLFLKCFKNFEQQYQLSAKCNVIGPGMECQKFFISNNQFQSQNKFLELLKNKERKLHKSDSIQKQSIFNQHKQRSHYSIELNKSFSSDATREDILGRWIPYKETDQILIYVGALLNNKGVGQFLAIAPSLIIKRPTLKILFFGSGPLINQMKELIKSYKANSYETAVKVSLKEDFVAQVSIEDYFVKTNLEISQRILFIQYTDQQLLEYLYPLCTLYIAPNRLQEECNMTILEAMCCGVTPVCNDHSWFSDVMDVVEKEFPQLAQVSRVGRAQFYERLPQTILATLDFIKNCGLSKRQYRQKIRNIAIDNFSIQHSANLLSQEI